jgi:Flp pilus assembly protein TadD
VSEPAGRDRAIAQGEARYRAGAFAEAQQIFARLAARHPDRLLGLCRLRTGDVAGGVECLATAHRLAPDDAYARLHYGIGLHAAGRNVEAAELFQGCLDLLPADPAPALNLAAVRLTLGEVPAALEAAAQAVRLAPELPQAHYTLGLAQLADHQPQSAAESFSAATQRAPGFADAWVNLGLAHYAMGDPATAEQAMRRALAAVPGYPLATANLAVFLRLRGGGEQAQAMLRDLLARNPGAVEARLNLAAWLLHDEKAEEALALLSVTPPRDANARRHWNEQRGWARIPLPRRGG